MLQLRNKNNKYLLRPVTVKNARILEDLTIECLLCAVINALRSLEDMEDEALFLKCKESGQED